MKSILPKILLLTQTLAWILYIQVPAALGQSQLTDTVSETREALDEEFEQLARPCNPFLYTQPLKSCMKNIGNCDVDVLEPMP